MDMKILAKGVDSDSFDRIYAALSGEFGEYAIDGFQGGNEAEFLFYKVRDNA